MHGGAGLFRRQGEFPAPLEHEFRLSPEALRCYKSGKSFLYRSLPFWMASLANRILVVIVPMVGSIDPGSAQYSSALPLADSPDHYHWYRALLAIERDMISQRDAEERVELRDRLNRIEQAVNRMKVPASFADQFYVLRGHIAFVRERLKEKQP